MSAAESRLVRSARPAEPADRAERLGDDACAGGWRPARPAAPGARRRRIERRPRISLRLGVRRGQRARAAQVAVELVEEQLLGRHADEAGVERLVEHRLHPAPARARVGRTSLRVARSRPIVAVRMSEWPMNAARLGPSGSDSSASTYSLGGAPGLVLVDGADHVLARDRLDPAEEVAGVDAADVDGRERAGAEQQRGHAVPHRLGQARARRAPRCRSACGCRPSPGSPTCPAASTTSGQPVSSSVVGRDDRDPAVAYAEVPDRRTRRPCRRTSGRP